MTFCGYVGSTFLKMARDDTINIFDGLPPESSSNLRGMLIDLVLATDMSQHFVRLKDFVQAAEQNLWALRAHA